MQALCVESGTSGTFARDSTSIPGEFSFRLVEMMEIVGGWNAVLRDALHDLDDVAAEAHEEGFLVPSHAALTNARRLLLAMYSLLPRRFEIYPTMDGEIAIDVVSGHGCSVVTLCGSDGGALCLVNIDGQHRRARYTDSSRLPDGFVREALEELAHRDERAA